MIIDRRRWTLALAALPPLMLFAMNTASWGSTSLETIWLAYSVVIYAGLLLACITVYLAVRQLQRGPSYAAPVISLLIAVAFIVWVGPDAYLDVAEFLSR
jgi:drug/metabolite transporter (DMT)-like permease